jgi:hypothetical protein
MPMTMILVVPIRRDTDLIRKHTIDFSSPNRIAAPPGFLGRSEIKRPVGSTSNSSLRDISRDHLFLPSLLDFEKGNSPRFSSLLKRACEQFKKK